MALDVIAGNNYFPTNALTAFNLQHKALWASGPSHFDGSDWTTAGVEQVLSSFYSAPTTVAGARDVIEKAIDLFDTKHVLRHSSGAEIYAHKAAGTPIAGTVGATGAELEAAMVAAWGPRCLELLTSLKNHMTNVGGTWHTTADTFNSVGTLPSAIDTKALLCSWTIILRSVYEAHRDYSAGVVHSSGDSTNTVAAAPPDTVDDWDAILAVLVEVADELEDHVEDAAYHANAMSVTYTVASMPSAVSTAFTRANAYKTAHGSHLADTALHDTADSTNTLSAADATTCATYIALAAEIFTDQTAHFRNAPTSPALRAV